MYGTVDTCGQGWTELFFCVALFWLKHSLQSTATRVTEDVRNSMDALTRQRYQRNLDITAKLPSLRSCVCVLKQFTVAAQLGI